MTRLIRITFIALATATVVLGVLSQLNGPGTETSRGSSPDVPGQEANPSRGLHTKEAGANGMSATASAPTEGLGPNEPIHLPGLRRPAGEIGPRQPLPNSCPVPSGASTDAREGVGKAGARPVASGTAPGGSGLPGGRRPCSAGGIQSRQPLSIPSEPAGGGSSDTAPAQAYPAHLYEAILEVEGGPA